MPRGFALTTGGKVTVTTAGTRVQLTSSASHRNLHGVYIEADEDNTGVMFVGGSDVAGDSYVAALAAGQGFEVALSSEGSLGLIDATSIWLDSDTNTQSVQWGFL